MIVSSNLPSPGVVPVRPPGTLLMAAVDVKWSKNYRIRGGNVPFCYSVAWLAGPGGGAGAGLDYVPFWYTSAYVHDPGETQELVAGAGRALGWHQRRQPRASRPRIVDTRYDAGHVLAGTSRRLVDVCADLRLEVTQRKLRGTSMTALHRRWLETGEAAARERITVLNLRHSLSTALAGAHAAGLGHWRPGLNVSRLLAAGLDGASGWLADPVFTALLEDPDAA